MAATDRPDWGDKGAVVVTEHGGAVAPVDPSDTFASADVEQRYRVMVARRMDRARAPADEARTALPVALVEEWESSGGFETRLAQAQRGAITVLERLDPGDRAAFTGSFDALPEAVRSAIFSEISLGSTGSVRNASDADMDRFASTPEGGALMGEWGARANRNVAIVRDRIGRIIRRLSADDVTAAAAWFDDLPQEDAAAIYRMLVGR